MSEVSIKEWQDRACIAEVQSREWCEMIGTLQAEITAKDGRIVCLERLLDMEQKRSEIFLDEATRLRSQPCKPFSQSCDIPVQENGAGLSKQEAFWVEKTLKANGNGPIVETFEHRE